MRCKEHTGQQKMEGLNVLIAIDRDRGTIATDFSCHYRGCVIIKPVKGLKKDILSTNWKRGAREFKGRKRMKWNRE